MDWLITSCSGWPCLEIRFGENPWPTLQKKGVCMTRALNALVLNRQTADGTWRQQDAKLREERRVRRRSRAADGHLRATALTDTRLPGFFYFLFEIFLLRQRDTPARLTDDGGRLVTWPWLKLPSRDAVPRERTVCIRRRTGPRTIMRGGGG